MKKLFIFLLCFITLSSFAAKRYISPSGSDAAAGTISAPRFSVASGWSLLSSTDTLYVRGGTYNYTSHQWLNSRSGNSSYYTCCFAYPGEQPIFNFGGYINLAGDFAFISQNQDYIHIRGIRVTNFPQQIGGNAHTGMSLTDGSDYCLVETCEIDHIGGYGFTISGLSTNNLILNCDSHHNSDPHSPSPYGGSNGFGCTAPSTATNNFLRGCRSWLNSDDGYDFFGVNGYFEIINCWSFRNGYDDTFKKTGDGTGFKLGPSTDGIQSIPKRKLTNCLSWDNYLAGFTANQSPGTNYFPDILLNCVAFRNVGIGPPYAGLAVGFSFQHNVPAHQLKNCLSYANSYNTVLNGASIQVTNSWQNGISVSGSDFISIDTTGVTGPRQADGSLPNLPFLKLKAGSDLIDAGTNVGIAYQGSAPDIGAYEFTPLAPLAPKVQTLNGRVQVYLGKIQKL